MTTRRLWSLVIGVVLVFTAISVSAQQPVAPAPPQIPYGSPVSLEQAKKVMAGAEAEAMKNKWNVVIVILDSGGQLVMLHRLDGAQFGSIDVARDKAAAQLRHALEEIGFFIVVNHGVPRELIARTFDEARRFHARPGDWKMKLRMNEHNNGYMSLGRYAVWTSDVNDNDKPDLNEAFFVRRERRPDDPLLIAGRRFAGPNVWPDDLPGFRETVLEYIGAVDALGRRMLPLAAIALDAPPDYFDTAFAESQFTFRLSHYPPVAAAP